MAPPFAGSSASPWLYFLLGVTTTVAALLVLRIWSREGTQEELMREVEMEEEASLIRPDESGDEIRIDRMGLSKKAEDVLEAVMEAPMLQNELPDQLGVSKATVSNAISELDDRGFVKRRKKANTYLVEPRMDELKEESGQDPAL